jgi:hypothetical protein
MLERDAEFFDIEEIAASMLVFVMVRKGFLGFSDAALLSVVGTAISGG